MPVSAPVPSSSSSTLAWNVVAVPSPRLAAHTDTADPPSISRPWPITPPAPQPIRLSGPSTSCTAASAASGAERMLPEMKRIASSHGRAVELDGRRRRGFQRRGARVGDGREAGSDADAHALADDTARPDPRRQGAAGRGRRARRGDRRDAQGGAEHGGGRATFFERQARRKTRKTARFCRNVVETPSPGVGPTPAAILARRVVALAAGHRSLRPTGVGKTAVAIAVADQLRARGEDPVAVSADALQVYEGLPILTGAASADEQRRLEHRLIGFVPIDETFSAGAYATRAHREIDALIAAAPAADRRRRHRPLPARRAGRARPQAAGRPRDPRTARPPTRARSGNSTPTCPRRSEAASSPPTASASCVPTSCSPPATRRRRPPTRRASSGPRRPAIPRCSPR